MISAVDLAAFPAVQTTVEEDILDIPAGVPVFSMDHTDGDGLYTLAGGEPMSLKFWLCRARPRRWMLSLTAGPMFQLPLFASRPLAALPGCRGSLCRTPRAGR